nr:DUF2798 domain-containing protein [Curvibacter sp. CHRR-16]
MVCILPTIALLLSGLITFINTGLEGDFALRWLKGFITTIPVMFVALGILGLLDKLIIKLMPAMRLLPRQLLTAVIAACIMESIVSAAVTMSTHGAGAGFAAIWAQAVVKSLPAGLVVSLLMGLVIKPRFLTPTPASI